MTIKTAMILSAGRGGATAQLPRSTETLSRLRLHDQSSPLETPDERASQHRGTSIAAHPDRSV